MTGRNAYPPARGEASILHNLEHSIVVAIGDVKLPRCRVDRDAVGARELALRRIAPHACRAILSSAGDACDLPRLRVIAAHQMALRIRDDDRIIVVHAEMFGAIHRRFQGRAAIARAAFGTAGIHHRADLARLIDHTKRIPAALKDVDLILMIHRHSAWQVFSDFCEMSAISLSNAVDRPHFAKREERYRQIIKRYTP